MNSRQPRQNHNHFRSFDGAKDDRVYTLEGQKVVDLKSFIEEMNLCFVTKLNAAPPWNGNWDAFQDLLKWPTDPYQIIFSESEKIRRSLESHRHFDSNCWEVLLEIFKENEKTVTLILH